MRIMGLDYGSKTVGVAISDELLLTAQGKEIIRRKEENKLRKTLARIEELIVEYGVEKIILGLPVNMDTTPSVRQCVMNALLRWRQMRLWTNSVYEVVTEKNTLI